jgi:hypothetical protein
MAHASRSLPVMPARARQPDHHPDQRFSEKSQIATGTRAVLAGYLSIKSQAADKECSDGQGSDYRDG